MQRSLGLYRVASMHIVSLITDPNTRVAVTFNPSVGGQGFSMEKSAAEVEGLIGKTVEIFVEEK